MHLSYLLENIVPIPAQIDCDILSLALDSRHIKKGGLFIALQGTQLDGRQYIPQAIAAGAAAVLVDHPISEAISWRERVPLIPVGQLQAKIGQIAARFYHYPAEKLRVIGTTGTSGKTSCTQFIAQILQSQQIPCGVIGTLGSGFYGDLNAPSLTTPDAITLQSTFQAFLEQGAKAVVMEVSSHSIDQGRINGINFDIGIFTNLSQDHLDYHHDMETYAAVKRRFIAESPIKHLLINADDSYGRKWITELAAHKSMIAYSTSKPSSDLKRIPTIYADHVELTLKGIQAHVHTPWGKGELSLPLIGEFNLSNGLAVLGTLCVFGMPFATALQHLSRLNTVPGRMQVLGGHSQPLVVVDYAHKPDALEKVLQALRSHTAGKLCCVFGCGGERDRGKRPLMAKIAEQWADQVIITNDNPRHEKPEAIATEIVQGLSHPDRVWIELDRSKAIQKSIQWASAKDCVLIAGKGAEQYQQIGDEKIPFDDALQVLKLLSNL